MLGWLLPVRCWFWVVLGVVDSWAAACSMNDAVSEIATAVLTILRASFLLLLLKVVFDKITSSLLDRGDEL